MQQADPKQVVLVTGAARRIGRAIATDLAAHGWQVGVHFGTSAGPAGELVADIRKAGGQAVALAADLGGLRQVRAHALPDLARRARRVGKPRDSFENVAKTLLRLHAWHVEET